MSVKELSKRLNRVRTNIRLLFLVDGLARLVIFLAVFSAVTFAIDWTIPDLPSQVRLAFLAIGAIIFASFAWRYLVYPLRVTISDDALVIYLEKKYPALHERLLSALQLARSGESSHSSPELVEALITDALATTRPLDFSVIINPKHQRRLGLLGLLLVCVSAFYAVSYPSNTAIWLNRIFGGNDKWPKRTFITVEVRNAPNHIAARNQDVSVIARVQKGSTSKVYIHYETIAESTGGSRDSETKKERMSLSEKNTFKSDFLQVKESFRFYVTGGDDRTDPITIRVLTPPGLEKIYCDYEYPDYIRLASGIKSDVRVDGGNIKAPLGTKVKITGFANMELNEAILEVMGQDNSKQQSKMEILPNAEGKPTLVQGVLTAMSDGTYSIRLSALNTLTNAEPIQYPIKVIRDTAPVIKVLEPNSEYKYVTPMATIPVKLLTTDDYGIKDISMAYALLGESQPKPPEAAETKPAETIIGLYTSASPVITTRIDSNHQFELTPLSLKEGDAVKYYFKAVDNCEIPQANESRSNEYRLIIISPEQMSKKVDEVMLRLKDEVRRLKDLQEKEAQEVSELSRKFEENSSTEPYQPNLNHRISAQRRISQETNRVSKDFNTVLNDININKFWDEPARKKLESLSQQLKEVAAEKSPAAVTQLNQARDAADKKNQLDSFKQAQSTQKDIADDLKDALSKMEQWEDYQEITRLTKDMLQRQKKASEDMKKTLADAPSAKEAVKEQEKTIQKDAETLESKMERVSDKLKDTQPYYAQKLKQALTLMRQNLLKENLREIVNALEQNMGGKAISKAAEAENSLNQLLNFLEDKMEQEELRNKIAQLQKTMKKLDDLKSQESEINKELKKASEAAAKSPDGSMTPEEKRKLERLKKRQKEIEKETNKLAEQAEQDREKKASKGLKNAAGKMSSASGNMSQQKPQDAQEDAEEAMQELQRVYEQLREKLKQLEEQEQQQKLEQLEQALREIYEKQDAIYQETSNFHNKRPQDNNELSREEIINLKKLGRDQADLAVQVARVEEELKTEQSPVFSWVVNTIKEDMNNVTKLLSEEYKTDNYTTSIQLDILNKLEELIEAFKHERLRRKPLQGSGGGGGGGGGGQPLVPPLAELKMLKTLQENLSAKTDNFRKTNLNDNTTGFDPVQQMILRRLSAQQGTLAEMANKSAEQLKALEEMMKDLQPKKKEEEQ